jgi:hypothetical protein
MVRKPKPGPWGKLVDIVAIIFAANPRLATAFSTLLVMAVTGLVSFFGANVSNAAKREAARAAREVKTDSLLRTSINILATVKRLDSMQTKGGDTLRVLNGAVNSRPWAASAKVRYLREEAKAKVLLGITAAPNPAAPATTTSTENYVSARPQPRSTQ